MNKALIQKIKGNQFGTELRNGEIPRVEEFHNLCAALSELAIEWRDKSLIDKNLMLDLFEQYTMIHGHLVINEEKFCTTTAQRDMAYKIRDLIASCLQ